jgi:hypothetical protein
VYRFGSPVWTAPAEGLRGDLHWPTVENVAELLGRVGRRTWLTLGQPPGSLAGDPGAGHRDARQRAPSTAMTARTRPAGATLPVSEVFGPTFQGEGALRGAGASFIRLGGCNLTCRDCDTPYTWDAARYDLRAELTP